MNSISVFERNFTLQWKRVIYNGMNLLRQKFHLDRYFIKKAGNLCEVTIKRPICRRGIIQTHKVNRRLISVAHDGHLIPRCQSNSEKILTCFVSSYTELFEEWYSNIYFYFSWWQYCWLYCQSSSQYLQSCRKVYISDNITTVWANNGEWAFCIYLWYNWAYPVICSSFRL